MRWLIVVTLLWAFSFSLIGEFLAGQVDGYLAVFTRMLLAFLVFAPFLKPSRINRNIQLKLMAIGAIQIGVMYLLFYHSFLYLTVPEVLLFTIFTPVYVTLIDDVLFTRSFHFRWVMPALLSVLGAAIIRYQSLSSDFLTGLLLIQGANLCFAFGQVAYKRLMLPPNLPQHNLFGWFFLGALIITLCSALILSNWQKMPSTITHYSVLLWLGLVASGAGYFLWNKGTRQVNTGQLATMNNALIPAGLLVNLTIWQKELNWPPFLIGGAIIILSIFWCSKVANKKY